ncbi:hypothetical protein Mapa_006670 [Marchantia paleacea]|nr:hypothetical protein Mapa_006670 [Marchantia paleacea]
MVNVHIHIIDKGVYIPHQRHSEYLDIHSVSFSPLFHETTYDYYFKCAKKLDLPINHFVLRKKF